MEKRTCVVVLLLFTGALDVDAQKHARHSAAWKLREISVLLGKNVQPMAYSDPVSFNKLSKGISLLEQDFSEAQPVVKKIAALNSVYSVLLGMAPMDRRGKSCRNDMRLRMGFSFCTLHLLSCNLQMPRRSFATLIKNGTDPVWQIDSSIWDSYEIAYRARQLKLDASLIFIPAAHKRLSFFVGVGLALGHSLSAVTRVKRHSKVKIDWIKDATVNPGKVLELEGQRWDEMNACSRGGSTAIITVPAGFDFRVKRKGKRSGAGKLHVIYEIRPGVNTTVINGYRTFILFSVQQEMGLSCIL